MKFDEYISNPMGRKNAVFGNREMYRNLYTEKLDKIMVRELGKVDYELYVGKTEFYIHFKIPSEVVPNFYYDTVIMFYTEDESIYSSRTLKDYDVKFYSNDPSFVYTFAHAFLENDLFIRDLVPRMSKEAVKRVATEKNPRNEVGYVKSIYFAYLLANRYGLFNKVKFEAYAKKYNRKTLLENITHADEKIESRRLEEEKLNKEKKRTKKQTQEIRNKDQNFARTSLISNFGKGVTVSRKTKTTRTAKRSKTI